MVNKSLQFLLIAAFLSPNAEEWEKLADLSLHQVSGFSLQVIFMCSERFDIIHETPGNYTLFT